MKRTIILLVLLLALGAQAQVPLWKLISEYSKYVPSLADMGINGDVSRVECWTFDLESENGSVDQPPANLLRVVYDEKGRLLYFVDAEECGFGIVFKYDAQGRVVYLRGVDTYCGGDVGGNSFSDRVEYSPDGRVAKVPAGRADDVYVEDEDIWSGYEYELESALFDEYEWGQNAFAPDFGEPYVRDSLPSMDGNYVYHTYYLDANGMVVRGVDPQGEEVDLTAAEKSSSGGHSDKTEYYDYQYDANHNWVSRKVRRRYPNRDYYSIEKRIITYR